MSPEGKHDLVKYRITKAKETFKEVNVLIEHGFWLTAVNRIYHSCFYSVIALLPDKGIGTKTHASAR